MVVEQLFIRRATLAAEDYLAIADIHHLTGDPSPPDTLLAFDHAYERSGALSWRYLAHDQHGTTVGVGHCYPVASSQAPRTYWVDLRVRHGHERRGIGSTLLHQIEADLAILGADMIWMAVPEEEYALLATLQRYRFSEQFRSNPLRLDLHSAPELHLAAHIERLAAHGLQISTLATCQQAHPHCLEQAHALHTALSREVPIPPEMFATCKEFSAFAVEAADAVADAFFIVHNGIQFVGLSFMRRRANTPHTLYQELTGVLPAYRGMGVAQVLKELTIDYGLHHGYESIETWVEDNNPAMLAINLNYGFVRGSGAVVLARSIAPAVALTPSNQLMIAR